MVSVKSLYKQLTINYTHIKAFEKDLICAFSVTNWKKYYIKFHQIRCSY